MLLLFVYLFPTHLYSASNQVIANIIADPVIDTFYIPKLLQLSTATVK